MCQTNRWKNNKGSSSVLIILILLCLMTFGVLSLMSSYADLNLSRKTEVWLANYYKIDAEGERFLQQVDACLQDALVQAGGDNGVFMELTRNELIQAGHIVNFVEMTGGLSVQQTFTSHDSMPVQNLTVEAEVLPLSQQIEGSYVIKQWRQWQDPIESEEEQIRIWSGE